MGGKKLFQQLSEGGEKKREREKMKKKGKKQKTKKKSRCFGRDSNPVLPCTASQNASAARYLYTIGPFKKLLRIAALVPQYQVDETSGDSFCPVDWSKK
jgi:hypothetical protein